MTEAEQIDMIRSVLTRLFEALQSGNANQYRNLMSSSDRALMSEDDVAANMDGMREQLGGLITFAIEGVVLHSAAAHAAAHVSMNFDKVGHKIELYNLILEDSEWRLDFDFVELLTSGH